jgi:Flp pilus assembly protein TadG
VFCSDNIRRHRSRRGQALVEFAVVSLVVYLMLAAILTFGQMLYSAQSVQQIANSAAREISRTPVSATADLMDVLYSSQASDYAVAGGTSNVRTALFDPALLQYNLSNVPAGGSILDAVRTWPVINQMLYPLMVPANLDPTSSQATYLVFPGAAPCSDSRNPNRTVYCVPEVTARAADGAETISWVPVIEEITPGAFSLASTASQSGMVTLRVNFGYQSPVMSAYPPSQTWPPEPTGGPIGANDGEVTTSPGGFYTPTAPPMDSIGGTYSGQYGLGSQQAMTISVRPFRRLISAQAIYRREVFQ